MSRREEEKGGEDAMLLHNNVPTGSPVSGGLHGWQFRAPCGHGTVKGPALLCDWHCGTPRNSLWSRGAQGIAATAELHGGVQGRLCERE